MHSVTPDEIITTGDITCPTNVLPDKKDDFIGVTRLEKSFRPQMSTI